MCKQMATLASKPLAPQPPAQTASLPINVLASFSADFLDAARCCRFLLQRLHPAGPACPRCHQPVRPSCLDSWWSGRKIQCTHCSRWFSGWSGTILHGSKLSPRQVVLMELLFQLNVTDFALIARLVGVGQRTVRAWCLKLAGLGKETVRNG